jgi:serralysin
MVILAASLRTGVSHSDSPGDMGVEVLISHERGPVFEDWQGQGSKIVKEFNASAGQKIPLLGFGSMSLDQPRTNLRSVGADVLFDLGNNQGLRIVGVTSEIISSIQIKLDRSALIPTFADDFDVLSLDLENDVGQPRGTWRTNFGYGGASSLDSRTPVNNGELQVYVDRSGTAKSSLNLNPFRITNGNLEIVAEPLKEDTRQFTWGRSYSSGLLTSKGTFSQRYGVFEIRAKIPPGKGLWPAFWLLPANNSLHSNVGGTHSSETKPIDVPDTSTGFHTYSIDWTKDTINWFFDNIQVASKPTPQDFHQPMYMLVNLAVGGGWPGAPDTATRFPAKYSIDWVRAYARRNPQ